MSETNEAPQPTEYAAWVMAFDLGYEGELTRAVFTDKLTAYAAFIAEARKRGLGDVKVIGAGVLSASNRSAPELLLTPWSREELLPGVDPEADPDELLRAFIAGG